MIAIEAFIASLLHRPDVDRLPWGLAVPHASHIAGSAKPGSRLRERACVADGGMFVHLSCCCGATPHELADDLGVDASWLGSHAGEQSLMLKIQRRLRDYLHDPEALELLRLKGLTVAQALIWKTSDAGWPPEPWASARAEDERKPCGACGAEWAEVSPPPLAGKLLALKHTGDCPRKPAQMVAHAA